MLKLNQLRSGTLIPRSLSQLRFKSTYVQEHDYTINPNTYVYTTEANQELFERFPLITAKKHRMRKDRPKKARMLAREFIDDSMYNPNYGYFSKSAEIFSPKHKFDVSEMSNVDEFIDRWAIEYKRENAVPQSKTVKNKNEPVKHVRKVSKQLWHTPSELFSPHYGSALARYIVAQHTKNADQPLEIYETGAGNGTLMLDILNYISKDHPEIYATMKYNIVEISASLALKQKAFAAGHEGKVEIHNVSIFDWNQPPTEANCFFIALEVWDNLAHDVIRYDNTTGKPYQGYVVVDPNGDFTEIYSPKLDKLAAEFLEARSHLPYTPDRKLGWHPLKQPTFWRNFKNRILPFKGNLSPPEYIPTRYFEMLHVLNNKFPNHHLIASDFTHFGERIEGYQSPVVQTFMEGMPVTVHSFMVLQGFFDIMFPTDFKLAAQLYEYVMGREATTQLHGEFLKKYVTDDAKTKAGELPILEFYRNAAFLTS